MFWDRFYHLCEANNKKPTPVGKEIGVSSGIISTWKKEGYCPSGEMLIKIANYFNCSIDYLVGRSDCISIQKSELSSEELLFMKKLRTLPEDSQEEIVHMINYKYEQYQKKRNKLLSNSESITTDDFHNMLA
ncbi:MAG: helix-turn-helix domain-containing protein [Ruminococcus flavefaciens]|nr:helix-turn-helix domain-containing protein [Eubacterium sp.]MCM1236918.1 helix-turn-helix domain-containing protein [Ruminococcus flavefaciens]